MGHLPSELVAAGLALRAINHMETRLDAGDVEHIFNELQEATSVLRLVRERTASRSSQNGIESSSPQ